MNTPTREFNFLEELGKDGAYHSLFPGPEAGFAIASLYLKIQAGIFPNGRFKEADIFRAFEETHTVYRSSYERLPKERLITVIGKLQEYFFRYDEEEQAYTLKTYATNFCKSALDALAADFNPTEIDIICRTLRYELQACASDEDLAAWIRTPFDSFKPRMNRQVDYLEHRLDTSVAGISAATRSENDELLPTLKAIADKLDGIRTQNAQLQSAFREMNIVNDILLQKLDAALDPALIVNGAIARRFFPHVKYTLRLIDRRLDRIQPKLRLFFSELNKPSFKKGLERLLNFILRSSTLESYKGDKVIALPNSVPIFQLRCGAPRFTIIEDRGTPFLKISRAVSRPPETPELVEKENRLIEAKLEVHNQIDNWLMVIGNRCAAEGAINFSEVFFQIVAEAEGNIDLACKVGYALLRVQALRPYLNVSTTTELVRHHAFKGLSVREMKIQSIK